MTKEQNEICDTQITSEYVGFLDNCFENSFALHNSISFVKEYSHELTEEFLQKEKNRVFKKLNESVLCKTISGSSSKNVSLSQNVNVITNKLSDWGLPLQIVNKYEARGIIEMFQWQIECLANSRVLLDGCNLVYSAPTSAGKTLVAEILTIKTILERQKKVIIILPFVSIVREKTFYLQDILTSSGIRVEGFMGSQSPPGGLKTVHVAICTIEKANSLVNKLLDEGEIWDLGAVIVDELHLLGDPNRGYILELLLTKIKYISSKIDNVHIQIIGMSATLPNLEVLASWLDAELFVTQYRPIPLDEFCLVGNKFFDKSGKCISINGIKLTNSESDNVLNICLDTIKEGCSILIFCMTKNRCESLAQAISLSFYKLGNEACESGLMLRNQLSSENIVETLEQLKNCPVGLDEILKKTISFGVAYHHAGLTYDERDIIEGAFKRGVIRVLVATSTLSSGVNLPARKVIVRSPVFQRQPMNIMTYKQMIGRAGRMGKDTKGESILICTEAEKKIGLELMMGALDPVKSCIQSEDRYMRAVLEMIASQVLCTKDELELYAKCTLLYAQQDVLESQNFLLDNTLEELKNFELVRIQSDGEVKRYVATPLGKACLSSSMAPNDGLSLFCELQKARQCLVLETDLHLIYLVTPYSVSSQWGNIDWLHLLTLWESLTKAMKRVGELVGVQESFIIKCLKGNNRIKCDQLKINIHKRFYTALALQDLVNEVSLSEVSTKFQCARGFLQSLQQAAATFAGMVTAFCRQLGWKNVEMLVSQFQDRLHFGIHSELIELMKLPSLNGTRARTLFDSGYETISSIASSDINVLENILHKSVPFQSEKLREGDDSDDVKKRNKIKNIWITGYCGMTTREAAENLIKEARKYLQLEIGVAEIKWNNSVNDGLVSVSDNDMPKVIKSKCDNKKDVNIYKSDSTVPANVKNNVSNIISEKNIKQENVNENIKNSDHNCSSADLNTERIVEKNLSVSLIAKVLERSVNSTLKTILKSSTPTLTGSQKSNNSSPSSLKEDIVWDSLNFTEATIENITKLRNANNALSPNISFGDTDQSIMSFNMSSNMSPSKRSSFKDVSLFSSDGDNINPFEESLPIDLIPSALLDNKDTPNQLSKQENVFNTDSGKKKSESPIICASEDENDIKLVYEEDNILDDSCLSISKVIEVVDSQESYDSAQKSNFKSPFKRQRINRDLLQPSAKKKKFKCDEFKSRQSNIYISVKPKITCDKSKTFTIQINEIMLDCYFLQGEDIVNNLHIIENSKEVAMYLNGTSKFLHNNEIIGSFIIKPSSKNLEPTNKMYSINGLAFYIGEYTCIYLDLSSLNGVFSTVKNKLKSCLKMKSYIVKILSLKTTCLQVKRWLGIDMSATIEDVSMMEWLIDNDEKVPTILFLMKKYCNIDLLTTNIKVDNQVRKLKYLDIFEDLCIKTWSIWMVSEKQKKYMIDKELYLPNTIDIEMKVSRILADCEFYGITVDKDLASRLLIDVRNSQDILQKKAYKLCGYNFNFNSTKDVAKALGMYKGRRVSTRKSVLSSHNTPLSSIVIYWRKLNSILTKTLYPLTEKACIYTEGNRINPTYTMFTCTGRVSMHEPNLQNVPRTFSIPAEYLTMNKGNDEGVIEFNCRNIFKAAPGYVIISADYCQLEMRILTHFSVDPVLTNIMKSDLDVFKSIAASWNNITEEEVDDDLRQKAKQLCYGILYGMGNKTLAQHLDVSEIEAAMFMDSFYKTYPAVRAFTQRVIDDCRAKGYVETLTKRRRYLPDINSGIASKKSAAERQAVNTTIQGSAADIAKTAMCAIDAHINSEPKPRLILQMHDELIYEVQETNKQAFMHILREVMENTLKLNVPLPVKVKCGYTWGSLEDVQI